MQPQLGIRKRFIRSLLSAQMGSGALGEGSKFQL